MTGPGTASRGLSSRGRPGSVLRLLRRSTLRTQLALLYAGVFVVLGVALLGVSGLLVGSSSASINGGRSSQTVFANHRFHIGPALVLVATMLVALALGWFIAGRFLRPLRTITATAQDISATNLSRRLALLRSPGMCWPTAAPKPTALASR